MLMESQFSNGVVAIKEVLETYNHLLSFDATRTAQKTCFFFRNFILFAICISTFSKLCKNMYTVALLCIL
jgi:hypothetical protein